MSSAVANGRAARQTGTGPYDLSTSEDETASINSTGRRGDPGVGVSTVLHHHQQQQQHRTSRGRKRPHGRTVNGSTYPPPPPPPFSPSLSAKLEKCRTQAQQRRMTQKGLMDELAGLLPFPKEVTSQMDTKTILRLAVCYLRVKSLLADEGGASPTSTSSLSDIDPSSSSPSSSAGPSNSRWPPVPIDPSYNQSQSLVPWNQGAGMRNGMEVWMNGALTGIFQDLMVEALHGFLMVVSCDGTILYLSDSVFSHTGLFQSEHTGKPVYALIHEEDHNEVKDALSSAEAAALSAGSSPCSFFCRLRSKKKNSHLKAPGYKLVYVSGHCKVHQLEPYVACMVHIVSAPSILEVKVEGNAFTTRHDLSMRIIFYDERLRDVLGYSKKDLIGQSLFALHHHDDLAVTEKCSHKVREKGEAVTGYYRLMTHYGTYVWLQTRGTMVMDRRTGKPSQLICMHFIVNKEKGDESLRLRSLLASNDTQSCHSVSMDPLPVPRPDGKSVNPLPLSPDDAPHSRTLSPTSLVSPNSVTSPPPSYSSPSPLLRTNPPQNPPHATNCSVLSQPAISFPISASSSSSSLSSLFKTEENRMDISLLSDSPPSSNDSTSSFSQANFPSTTLSPVPLFGGLLTATIQTNNNSSTMCSQSSFHSLIPTFLKPQTAISPFPGSQTAVSPFPGFQTNFNTSPSSVGMGQEQHCPSRSSSISSLTPVPTPFSTPVPSPYQPENPSPAPSSGPYSNPNSVSSSISTVNNPHSIPNSIVSSPRPIPGQAPAHTMATNPDPSSLETILQDLFGECVTEEPSPPPPPPTHLHPPCPSNPVSISVSPDSGCTELEYYMTSGGGFVNELSPHSSLGNTPAQSPAGYYSNPSCSSNTSPHPEYSNPPSNHSFLSTSPLPPPLPPPPQSSCYPLAPQPATTTQHILSTTTTITNGTSLRNLLTGAPQD